MIPFHVKKKQLKLPGMIIYLYKHREKWNNAASSTEQYKTTITLLLKEDGMEREKMMTFSLFSCRLFFLF
jgi:hypothetical protein